MQGDPGGEPGLLIYLPGIGTSPANSARRVAEILADKASEGPGTFAVEGVTSPHPGLADGARILTEGGEPVLDVLEADYRPSLLDRDDAASGLGAQLRRLLRFLRHAVWAGQLLWGAWRRRPKNGRATVQLLVGFLASLVLVTAVGVTVWAVMVALGFVGEPTGPERLQDALAIGLTGLTTWLYVRARPAIAELAMVIAELMEFVHDERREGSVARRLTLAIDQVLEANPDRRIHLLGYSLGSLVTVAFAFPRDSLHLPEDPRHAVALAGLITVGSPVDFVRLFVPDYMCGRTPRAPTLPWTNVYIAADVLGSNFLDHEDVEVDQGRKSTLAPMSVDPPISKRYTREELTWRNVWGRKGFQSHSGYWDEVDNESCLGIVLEHLELPAGAPN